jgi:DNA-binding NtrC family response regulator
MSARASGEPIADSELPLREACELFERQYVMRVLHRLQWNISGAARVLRVHRNTLLRKLLAWGLRRPTRDEDQSGRPPL